jgi:hypothetical protein
VFLDLLSMIDLAVRRSLPGPRDPMIHWSEAVPGVGAKMIREHRGVTWNRSDEPDNELYQWGSVVAAILDAEEEWHFVPGTPAFFETPDLVDRLFGESVTDVEQT